VVLGAPTGYERMLRPLPSGARIVRRLAKRNPWVQLFCTRRAGLEERLPVLLQAVDPDGTIWISWPKRSSGVASDMSEDVVRAVALPLGLVDIKVCAVDEVWSGLKLVRRRELR
jgi:hypothetical protein